MSEYSVIGKRLPRVDGVVKVTGEAKYVADLYLPGMLSGKILRSPHPHARILNIDTTKAQRLPGVRAIITGKDTRGVKFGAWPLLPQTIDQYSLAMDRVRYIGDEVAAVAAIEEDIAEEALELIEVEYEPLPAVFDPEDAMQPGAPKIHDVERNISFMVPMSFGNIEEGFKQSDYIREDRFVTQPVTHCTIEQHAALASFDSSGKLTIWASTQCPEFVRRDLAVTLGIPESRISVIKPFVGGGFGGKGDMFSGDFCAALLSMTSRRPVKIVYNREEVFTATWGRHPMIIELKTGVKRDGTLVATQVKLIANGGAYNSIGPLAIVIAGTLGLHLPLKIPNVKYEGYRVYTNNPPCGAMRGLGTPQMRFALDSQIDLIARDLGIDPLDMRLKNAVQPGEITPNKFKITTCGINDCIEKTSQSTKWKKKYGKLPEGQGIGMGCMGFVSGCGRGHLINDTSGAFVKVHDDGSVTLLTGAPDIGQGSDTVLSQILAEEMGVALEDIRIISADTEFAPQDSGAHSSRVTCVSGNAVRIAAADAKKQLFEVVAEKLEANIEDLEAKNRKIYVKGSPERGISFAEAVHAAQSSEKGRVILGRGQYDADTERPNPKTGEGNVSEAYSFGAQIAEVEVDREQGKVKLKKMTVAHDCGVAINPMAVEGQLEGSVVMGQGQSLLEGFLRKNGKTLNPSFLDYRIPTSLDAPEVETIIVETGSLKGPFGAKECGEGTMVSTVQAITNAVHDAIGVRIKELPITPEKILKALEKKNKGKK